MIDTEKIQSYMIAFLLFVILLMGLAWHKTSTQLIICNSTKDIAPRISDHQLQELQQRVRSLEWMIEEMKRKQPYYLEE